MDTRERSSPKPDEAFWQSAFVAATWPILRAHDGNQLTPQGAAHLCKDFADAALIEFQQRFP